MKRLVFTLYFIGVVLACSGQAASPFRQFFFNPYLYNPGFTGINGSTEIYLAYRKQWVNFNDGPTTMGLNLQYPTHKKVALGLNIIADEVVALRTTTALATFAYVLPISEDQSLRFGISGGVGMNDLNLEDGEFDTDDPTILNASQNNFYADGNFGAVYTYKGLRLGFSLPQLFESNRFTVDNFNKVSVSSTSLGNRFYSASYKIPVGTSGIAVEPYLLYNQRADKQNSWEAATIVNVKEKIWGGASYHEFNGFAFFLGMNVKNFLRFSYSYELPPVDKDFVNTNSHELQLSLRLGKKRDPILTKKAAKAQQQTTVADSGKTPTEETKAEEVIPDPSDASSRNTGAEAAVVNSVNQSGADSNTTDQPVTDADTQATQEATVDKTTSSTNGVASAAPAKKTGRPPMSFTLATGHYVVVGAFKIMDNALKYSMDLESKGFATPLVAISPKNNLYYVYIFSTYDIEEARRERNQYRLKRPFSEAWVLTID